MGTRTGATPSPFRVASRVMAWWLLIGMSSSAAVAADLNHPPLFPHIKVLMTAYGRNYAADQLTFIDSHYDVRIGDAGGNPVMGTLEAPGFSYTNYYCMYVGSDEYLDAQAWTQAQGVDFEAFFVHYAEPTMGTFGGEAHILPAGSRIPTYGWYGTGGDLTKAGARVVMNPGNPNYRVWKLDYLARQMAAAQSNGAFVDNTRFTSIAGLPTVSGGGSVQEYPTGLTTAYGDDILALFREFSTAFGTRAGQVPNMAGVDDTRVYPYVWGIYREFFIQPNGVPALSMIDTNLAGSAAAGVRNLLGSVWSDTRWDMAALAFFYLVQNDSCYFFPYLDYVASSWGVDPRMNQWYKAVAYDVGLPLASRYIFATGADPSASARDTLSATVTQIAPTLYRLTDVTKTWITNQWKNMQVVFPSSYTMPVYQSGTNWIDLYNPKEIPSHGTYEIASALYTIYARPYEKAMVLWRPKTSGTADISDTSAVVMTLPVTADNPTGSYYLLTRDGVVDPLPITALSLRNTDGAVLIKESALSGQIIFRDVPVGFWAYDDIYTAAYAGIVHGYDDSTYRPGLPVTRAQMAAYISRALAGSDDAVPTGPITATFTDIAPDYWAYRYIEYAVDQGIVQGYDNDTYRPEEELNRAHMAVFMARALGGGEAFIPTAPTLPSFLDVATDYWAYRHIEYLLTVGVTTGFDDGTYRPTDICKRDQMAVFIVRAFLRRP